MGDYHNIFRIVHLLGVFFILLGLAALWGVAIGKGGVIDRKWRLSLAILHGIGMAIVLATGLAMKGPWAGWLTAKLAIWLVLGASMVIAKRKAQIGVVLLVGWAVFAATAALLAINKPF